MVENLRKFLSEELFSGMIGGIVPFERLGKLIHPHVHKAIMLKGESDTGKAVFSQVKVKDLQEPEIKAFIQAYSEAIGQYHLAYTTGLARKLPQIAGVFESALQFIFFWNQEIDLLEEWCRYQKDATGETDRQAVQAFLELFLTGVKNQRQLVDLAGHRKMDNRLKHIEALIEKGQERRETADPIPLQYRTKVPEYVELTGRNDELDSLRQQIQQHNRLLLHSLGGVGKTACCSALFWNYSKTWSSDFDQVLFFEYGGDIDRMVYDGVEVQTDDYQQDLITIWNYIEQLSRDKKLLVIVDDIRPHQQEKAKPLDLTKLNCLMCNILLSSREGRLKGYCGTKLKFLTTDSCIKLFQEVSGFSQLSTESRQQLSDIVQKRLGNHTLAVRLTAGTAKLMGSLPALADELERNNFSIQQEDSDEDISREFEKLFNLSGFEANGPEISILEAFSVFPPQKPLSTADSIQWLYGDAKTTEEQCRKTMSKLADMNWLQRTEIEDGLAYSMHQVIADAVQNQTAFSYENHVGLITACSQRLYFSSTEIFTKCTPYMEFGVSLISACAKNEQHRVLATLYNNLAALNQSQGDYDKAIELLLKALAINEKALGTEHLGIATTYNNLALLYRFRGNYDIALDYHLKALTIREKVLGTEHPDTATSYSNLGRLYEFQGYYDKALEYYKKALVIKEKSLGSEHSDTATTYNNLAGLYQLQGNYDKSLEYYQKTLAIKEKVLGSEHPDTAATYNNLARLYQCQGNYGKSLVYFQKALAIVEKVLGTEHPDTACTYNNLAQLYQSQGDYDKALDYLLKALAIREKVLGSEHPDTVTTYNNLAGLYDSQGEYDKALDYYLKALTIFEKILGSEHPDTATTYNNLAALYYSKGKYDKALGYYMKALTIWEKILGTEHPNTATTYNNLAALYYSQGKYDKALKFYRRALEVRENVFGKNHPNCQIVRNNVENVKEKMGE